MVVLSVTEGEDKPLKYPVMFKAADLVLVTKTDLAGVLGVDLDRIDENLARVMPRPAAIRLSARSGEGMAAWVSWLAALKRRTGKRTAARPDHFHDHAAGYAGLLLLVARQRPHHHAEAAFGAARARWRSSSSR